MEKFNIQEHFQSYTYYYDHKFLRHLYCGTFSYLQRLELAHEFPSMHLTTLGKPALKSVFDRVQLLWRLGAFYERLSFEPNRQFFVVVIVYFKNRKRTKTIIYISKDNQPFIGASILTIFD